MNIEEAINPLKDFDNLTRIGASISYKFEGIFERDQRKTKSTYYLAKVLNTNMTILSIINGSFNGIETVSDSLDLSSIYSLLRNQLEICNIYWYLIDDYSSKENLDLKLAIFEYNDTISSQIIYNSLLFTEENQKYFKEKEIKQSKEIQNNFSFNLLDNNTKKQILNGNKSTIDTQFEIIIKRKINLNKFKAYYKIFSTHTHSSPTAIKNLTSLKVDKTSEEFEIIFMFLSINYISQFIADMIISVYKLWNFDDLSKNDEQFLRNFSSQL